MAKKKSNRGIPPALLRASGISPEAQAVVSELSDFITGRIKSIEAPLIRDIVVANEVIRGLILVLAMKTQVDIAEEKDASRPVKAMNRKQVRLAQFEREYLQQRKTSKRSHTACIVKAGELVGVGERQAKQYAKFLKLNGQSVQ